MKSSGEHADRVPFHARLVTLTKENWREIIYDDTKDVFVKFYATWCPHCSEIAEEWREFAHLINEKEANVVVA